MFKIVFLDSSLYPKQFFLSAKADQRKLHQNVGLENMNVTSNYDITNNAHQIQ